MLPLILIGGAVLSAVAGIAALASGDDETTTTSNKDDLEEEARREHNKNIRNEIKKYKKSQIERIQKTYNVEMVGINDDDSNEIKFSKIKFNDIDEQKLTAEIDDLESEIKKLKETMGQL